MAFLEPRPCLLLFTYWAPLEFTFSLPHILDLILKCYLMCFVLLTSNSWHLGIFLYFKSSDFFSFFLRFILYSYWKERGKEKGGERQRERERERERGRWEREISISCLLHVPWLGIKFTTQACTLTRNRTGSPLVCRKVLQPTKPHWPGLFFVCLFVFFCFV